MAEPVGELIPPCNKILFRQIHPAKFTGGSPGKLNFVPEHGKSNGPEPGKSNFVPEDNVNLSTRREEIGAQGAHEAHVALGLQSAGTWGFTVQEAAEANTPGLPAYNDEGCGIPPAPPFHVSVRFPENITRGMRERIARQLHAAAKKHGKGGWLYRPGSATSGTDQGSS